MSARSDPQGYYRVLGVSHRATADEIRLAFRARAMDSHPDQADGRGDSERFRLIREAYEVLRDPRRRMAYDASGLVAPERAPAASGGWPDGFDRGAPGRASGTAAGVGDPPFAATAAAAWRPADSASPNPRAGSGVGVGPRPGMAAGSGPGPGQYNETGFAAASSAGDGRRRRRTVRSADSRLWPLVSAGLALLLLVVMGSWWSTYRQLDDRQGVVTELYDRLAQLGEEQADLRMRYRSLAFLDLERAVRRGTVSPSARFTADTGRAAYRFDIGFAGDRFNLDDGAAQDLARALVEIARHIDQLPPESAWLIVLEARAARAALAEQVAVESWEPALLRLATVLDELLAQGLPAERLAIRFNAGFAAPANPSPEATVDQVSISLLCCID